MNKGRKPGPGESASVRCRGSAPQPKAPAKSTGGAAGEILHIRLRPLFDAKGDEPALNQLAEHAAAMGPAIDGRVHFFDEEDQGVFRRLALTWTPDSSGADTIRIFG